MPQVLMGQHPDIRRIAKAIAFAPLVGLVGCTPLEWYDSGLGANAPESVKQDCRRLASAEAFSSSGWPAYGLRPFGWPFYDPWFPFRYQDTAPFEQQLFDNCMPIRGYHLLPARPADRAARSNDPPT